MGKTGIELTIRYGAFGEKHKTVALNIDDSLARELLEPVELSDDPFSLMIKSPAFYGGVGNAVTARKKTFQMRRAVAAEIARQMVPALLQAFGINDELDGYKVAEMSEEEVAFYRLRGKPL